MTYPQNRRPADTPLEQWVWDHLVQVQSGCWEFGRTCRPYGQVWVGRTMYLAHRIIYEEAYGPIPDSLCVLHHCDNPPCCRPTHLFLGTRPDNHADMVAKGRNSGGGVRRLTDQDYSAIGRARAAGERVTAIAARYGVTREHVYTITAQEDR